MSRPIYLFLVIKRARVLKLKNTLSNAATQTVILHKIQDKLKASVRQHVYVFKKEYCHLITLRVSCPLCPFCFFDLPITRCEKSLKWWDIQVSNSKGQCIAFLGRALFGPLPSAKRPGSSHLLWRSFGNPHSRHLVFIDWFPLTRVRIERGIYPNFGNYACPVFSRKLWQRHSSSHFLAHPRSPFSRYWAKPPPHSMGCKKLNFFFTDVL